MAKCCPICDQPISGSFCKGCFRFVKPVEMNTSFRYNKNHDKNNDAGCDYHGNTDDFHKRFATDAEHYSYHENSSARPETHMEHTENHPQNPYIQNNPYMNNKYADPNMYGKPVSANTNLNTYPDNGTKKSGCSCGCVLFVFILAGIIAAIAYFSDKGYEDYYETSYVPAEESGSLTFLEWSELCEQGGFDSDGYKDISHEEAQKLDIQYYSYPGFSMTFDSINDRLSDAFEEFTPSDYIYTDKIYLDRSGEEIGIFDMYKYFYEYDEDEMLLPEKGVVVVYGNSKSGLADEIYVCVYSEDDAVKFIDRICAVLDIKVPEELLNSFESYKNEDGKSEVYSLDGSCYFGISYSGNAEDGIVIYVMPAEE